MVGFATAPLSPIPNDVLDRLLYTPFQRLPPVSVPGGLQQPMGRFAIMGVDSDSLYPLHYRRLSQRRWAVNRGRGRRPSPLGPLPTTAKERVFFEPQAVLLIVPSPVGQKCCDGVGH